ncbi:alpha/beta hydrolase fold domain-containing protein [Asticcacaulis sp. BYS171W]|uniref:Alpha/beta hydrolase fold domain-containing protein n=1 Tax=Asticcacaulis aquaticus TaxID=2984212 RepID=A0ABT5HUG4_9CAUL|nr:alpha/beta hydrolase fold domain-containing protein [Asticcacaulis aquaticus]
MAISPWCNLEHTGSSMVSRDDADPTVSYAGLVTLAKTFPNGALKNDPDASPVFADVRNLPPIMVQVGESEVMLSEGIQLASHLAMNRVRVSLEVWPEMFHVWHMYATMLPEGLQALQNGVAFIEAAYSAVDTEPRT